MNTSRMYPNDRKLDVSLDQPNMRTTPVPLCTDVEGTVSYLIHLWKINRSATKIFHQLCILNFKKTPVKLKLCFLGEVIMVIDYKTEIKKNDVIK